jgi:FkbH-like protein
MQVERAPEYSTIDALAGKPIKLAVWSSDEALSARAGRHGDEFAVNPRIRSVVAALDERGVVQSVVGKVRRGIHQSPSQRLEIADFFLYPQLDAEPDAQAINRIANQLNIPLSATLLIDDPAIDSKGVSLAHPDIRIVGITTLRRLAHDPLMGPGAAGSEPRPRRLVYLEELARAQSEAEHNGDREQFLAALDMEIEVAPATKSDLSRLRELVTRTNQLCVTYADAELERLLSSREHACLLVSLRDRFGDCGNVGVVLMEISSRCWTLQLFLFSCRVAQRGVNAMVLDSLLREASKAGVRLFAQFKSTSKNETLLQEYLSAGFEPIGSEGGLQILEHKLARLREPQHSARLSIEGLPQVGARRALSAGN